MQDQILTKITDALRRVEGICAVVLGGSQATGTAGENSDIDIGLYYERDTDWAALQSAAVTLDDAHRPDSLAKPGEWGPWVNGGAWLCVDGQPVDLILREMDRVKEVVDRTDRGEFSPNYQTGHPHAYLDVMYRGELACCRVLTSADEEFLRLRERARQYPDALRNALMSFFGFEADFSCMLAKKALDSWEKTGQKPDAAEQGTVDRCYLAGHVFRSVSALNQTLFAENRQWCLNEKKAVLRADRFERAPKDYARRVNEIFAGLGTEPGLALEELERLCRETSKMRTPQ